MWTVIYIASNRERAESLMNMLMVEGVLATLRPTGVSQNGNGGSIEILVPESEAEEAHEILASNIAF
ncbi:MAG: glutamate decarboxylase [Thermacetogeniaceae bacterium]|jgi:hypothetical protein|nr:DUF2007 domain-containing protein [Thermoanaerobacterales bacterium]NLN21010.1 glutamate decarboxylase [Syntrophomonadaceae bacterium]